MVSQNNMAVAQRPGQERFGRPKNCDYRHAQERGEMHCAGVICKEQTALSQFVDKLIERRLADPVDAMIAYRTRDLFAYRSVIFRAEQDPLRR